MSRTTYRHFMMLSAIPVLPRKISTGELVTVLEEKGFSISQRSVQRDLRNLKKFFPELTVDGNKDCPGWSWKKEFVRLFPVMSAEAALAFRLFEMFIARIYPPSLMENIRPYFECADNILKKIDNAGYRTWQESVRMLSRTMPLKSAEPDAHVMDTVCRAMLSGKRFRGRYRRRDGDEVEYDINPLGLVFMDSVVYLVATMWEYRELKDVRQLAMHRFLKANLLERDATRPEGFSLDEYISKGNFQYLRNDGSVKLKIVFSGNAGNHLLETRLSHDQKTYRLEDGRMAVEAEVSDTSQLRWWLLGLGANVEVVEPEELRREFAEISGKMAGMYNQNQKKD